MFVMGLVLVVVDDGNDALEEIFEEILEEIGASLKLHLGENAVIAEMATWDDACGHPLCQSTADAEWIHQILV